MLLASCGLALATGALASQALASKYACVACHQTERKLVGPSWIDIATRYADSSISATRLAESIKKGGSGKWGATPMPPRPALSDAEAEALAGWVLGYGKKK